MTGGLTNKIWVEHLEANLAEQEAVESDEEGQAAQQHH